MFWIFAAIFVIFPFVVLKMYAEGDRDRLNNGLFCVFGSAGCFDLGMF
jgi:hypothetical protein